MVTVAKQQNEFKQNKNDGYRNNRNYRAAKQNQGQQGRERQEPSGPPVTECAYCELIRNKDVPQENLRMDFKDRHRVITDRPIYPNDCLPWLRLNMDERERVLENNKLRCKFCLKTLKPMTKGNSCGKGRHIYNTGRNGMCIDRNCDKNATVC